MRSVIQDNINSRDEAAQAAAFRAGEQGKRDQALVGAGKRLATQEAFDRAQDTFGKVRQAFTTTTNPLGGGPVQVNVPDEGDVRGYVKRNDRQAYDNDLYGTTDNMNAQQAQVRAGMQQQGSVEGARAQLAKTLPGIAKQDPTNAYKVIGHYVEQGIISPEEGYEIGKANGLNAAPTLADFNQQ